MINKPKRSGWFELPSVVEVKRVATNIFVIHDNQTFDFADAATIDDTFGSEQALAYGGASDAEPEFGQSPFIRQLFSWCQ